MNEGNEETLRAKNRELLDRKEEIQRNSEAMQAAVENKEQQLKELAAMKEEQDRSLKMLEQTKDEEVQN